MAPKPKRKKAKASASSKIEETALPKPKRAARKPKPPSEDGAQDILRAVRRAAAPKRKLERFIIADSPEQEKRKADLLDMPVPRRRRRVR